MGDALFPLKQSVFLDFQERVKQELGIAHRSRGGLRAIGDAVLPEDSLVVKPYEETLKVVNRLIPCCLKHPGFCATVDDDIRQVYVIVLKKLRVAFKDRLSGSGLFLCEFRGFGDGDAGSRPELDMLFFFSSADGSPRFEVCTRCVKASDGPVQAGDRIFSSRTYGPWALD